MHPAGTATLVLLSVAATILSGQKLWYGWLLAATACAGWATYGVLTHQWAIIIVNAIYTSVQLFNGWKWRRETNSVAGPQDRRIGHERAPWQST